ncbi:hypothetical protein BaRGS_00018289 [Batillaria attramentaria]|uniref:Uncharacterized protein n=1 Tax=Batillaria attramentaria TaxID=370345 RepID=A0ABD0KU86_9CAEN
MHRQVWPPTWACANQMLPRRPQCWKCSRTRRINIFTSLWSHPHPSTRFILLSVSRKTSLEIHSGWNRAYMPILPPPHPPLPPFEQPLSPPPLPNSLPFFSNPLSTPSVGPAEYHYACPIFAHKLTLLYLFKLPDWRDLPLCGKVTVVATVN